MDNGNFREEIASVIKRYYIELKKVISLDGVYIFGSYAKGTFTDDSDIDVLVVSPDFKGDIIEDMRLLMKLRRKIDRRIEPHPIKMEEFIEGNPFLDQIKKDMIKIA